jgi:NTE family protein
LFYQKKKHNKKRPVLGIKLSSNEQERPKRKIRNAIEMFSGLFETMKDAHDERHISSRHEKDIIFIPVENIVSTEFQLNEEKKLALLELGRNRTNDFLTNWTF